MVSIVLICVMATFIPTAITLSFPDLCQIIQAVLSSRRRKITLAFLMSYTISIVLVWQRGTFRISGISFLAITAIRVFSYICLGIYSKAFLLSFRNTFLICRVFLDSLPLIFSPTYLFLNTKFRDNFKREPHHRYP